MDDFDDASMYYADKDFYEKESPERSRNKRERDFDLNKKSPEELQEYLSFRRRGFKVKPKKGRGSFARKDRYGKTY